MFETLQEDQKSRWEKGDRVPVAFYLKQYPELKRDSQVIERLVQEEMRLRENAGEAIDKAAYLREYPECRAVIEAYQSTFETIGPSIAELAAPAPAPPAVVEPNQPTIAFETQLADFETALPGDSYETVPGPATTSPKTGASPPPRPGSATPASTASFPLVPGFEIQSELGRGGMGIVYRAKQISANRMVALKVVRNDQLDMLPARARADALGRFTTEAHAAASLQHDNIVSVYEVGEVPSKTPGGTPLHYYAMRFVQGESLFDLVREGPLENRRAANYIQKIARALQAAHDQGILHRDIKPHNVMIEKGSDRPLLTDFGLAKIIDSGNSMTYSGQVMGTPSYMSPEQAVDAAQVTPSADQYSLGATLYHLLTGRPPFVASSVPETIRQILDKQPVELRELNSSVHRDLETICLKSIQKDPLRRYSCCQELADDLQRYLEGVPIVARPVSRAERAVRWCRRNPGMATMIGSVAMLALSTLLAIVLGYRNTSAALAVSESRLEKALQVVDELFVRVSEDELLNEPGMQPLRRELLEKALKHYQYFLSESQDRGKVADEVAAAHYRVGMIQQLTGHADAAEMELEEARAQQEALLKQTPERVQRLKAYSDTLNALGSLFNSQHRQRDSMRMFEASAESRNRLAELAPDNLEYQRLACNAEMNLGVAKITQGDLQDGLIAVRNAQERRLKLLEVHTDDPKLRRDLARGWYSLGKFELQQQDFESASEHFESAVSEFKKLLDKDARSLSLRFDCSVALRLLGTALSDLGEVDRAMAAYEEALRFAQKLYDANPDVALYKSELAVLSMNLGSNYEAKQDLTRAEQSWQDALRLERELLLADPESTDVRGDVATCLGALGDLAMDRGDDDAALKAYEEALPMIRLLAEQLPEDPVFQDLLKHVETRLEELKP